MSIGEQLHRELSGLSRTAVQTRVHWLDSLDLVSGRIGIAQTSPDPRAHLLHGSGKSLCGNARARNLNIYDTTRKDLPPLCQKCHRQKREMLKAYRVVGRAAPSER